VADTALTLKKYGVCPTTFLVWNFPCRRLSPLCHMQIWVDPRCRQGLRTARVPTYQLNDEEPQQCLILLERRLRVLPPVVVL
jgi:hypothetical protein